jgi:hypothetical protein
MIQNLSPSHPKTTLPPSATKSDALLKGALWHLPTPLIRQRRRAAAGCTATFLVDYHVDEAGAAMIKTNAAAEDSGSRCH